MNVMNMVRRCEMVYLGMYLDCVPGLGVMKGDEG